MPLPGIAAFERIDAPGQSFASSSDSQQTLSRLNDASPTDDQSVRQILARQTRNAITEAERKAIREHAKRNPDLSQGAVADWFENTYFHHIARSSLSDSLSSRYAYLDNLSFEDLASNGGSKRRRIPSFPEVEKRLVEWYRDCISRKETVTGPEVKKTAMKFWQEVPYRGTDIPKFSNGWLENWKQRNGINLRSQDIEDTPAAKWRRGEVDDQIEREMASQAKRQKVSQTRPGALPWDMLRPETENDECQAESWDRLRPVADSLQPPEQDDSESDHPSSDTGRPGYDPDIPAWIREHTWDELPWVKNRPLVKPPKPRVRKKKIFKKQTALPDDVPLEGDGDEPEQVAAHRPVADQGQQDSAQVPSAFNIYFGNPRY